MKETRQPIVERNRLPNFQIPPKFVLHDQGGNVLPILLYPDKRLREKSIEVVHFDDSLISLANDMAETMYAARGVGLSAIQVGDLRRIFVCDIYANADTDLPLHGRRNGLMAVVNPKIVSVGGKPSHVREGCLSFPGVIETVERPFHAVISAQNLHGEQGVFEAIQLFARVILHEIDHFEGRLLIDHLGPLARNYADKKIRRFSRSIA